MSCGSATLDVLASQHPVHVLGPEPRQPIPATVRLVFAVEDADHDVSLRPAAGLSGALVDAVFVVNEAHNDGVGPLVLSRYRIGDLLVLDTPWSAASACPIVEHMFHERQTALWLRAEGHYTSHDAGRRCMSLLAITPPGTR